MNTSNIVQKLWNYYNVLRDSGMSYDDHVEQFSCLRLLKMAEARADAVEQLCRVPGSYELRDLPRQLALIANGLPSS
ncbi:MAG: hypothetical protein A3F74_07060 [Betaproteobacteria bacterium RIFCSPLOWO2_12_FULL_62_58]|nr:MAG: hypothetical protein A3F74_07060 [Betaproteobacteria bacterium RIFCSPLOWO2_12_FULL_62_58]